MTNPIESIGSIGEVYVNVSSRVKEGDARKAVDDIDAMANKEFTRLGTENGQNWSNTFAAEVKKALGTDAAGKPDYRTGTVSGILKNTVSNATRDAFRDTRNIVDDVSLAATGDRAGGVFGRGFGRSVMDVFRSIFSATGGFFSDLFDFDKSPILSKLKDVGGLFGGTEGISKVGGPIVTALTTAFQASAMGTMVAYITAAVYGIQSFISLLYIVPGLLASIVAQGVTLMFVFHGLGTVIGQVFQAKSIEEVDAALQGVNTTVANQLRQLFQWKQLFSDIAKQAQPAFFGAIGENRITEVFNNIGPALSSGVVQIAAALGGVFDNLLRVMADPRFAQLFDVITNSTVKWLTGFGPALGTLVQGFDDLAVAVAPFMDWFGEKFNNALIKFGDALSNLGKNKDFQDFLERAKVLMPEFVRLLGSAINLIVVLVQKFGEADDEFKRAFGVDFLTAMRGLTDVFAKVVDTFGTPTFTAAIVILLSAVTTFFTFLTTIAVVFAAIDGLIHMIGDGMGWLGKVIGNWAYDVWQTLGAIPDDLRTIWNDFIEWLRKRIFPIPGELVGYFAEVPQRLGQMLVNLAETAYHGGLNLMARLGQGIRDGIQGAVNAIGDAAEAVASFLRGHSPVRVGPLSGGGDPFLAGQNIVNRLALGMKDATPGLAAAASNVATTVVFSAGSIQNNYNNANPNNAQTHAQIMNNQVMGLMARDTRLAVRTLGAV